MEGGRGSTWANFEETAQKNDALMGWPPSRNPLSPTTGRLCREDMAIYGEEPALDSLSLVVCGDCGRVVKSQALVNHKEQYHSQQLDIPTPRPVIPPYTPPLRTPHTVGLSSSAMSTPLGGVRGDRVMGFTASDLPSTAFSGATTVKAIKEYDPTRHCGVWIEEEKRQCTHSLNCKIHSLDARQSVRGRSKSFALLLKERKLKKKKEKLPKRTDSQLPTASTSSILSPSPTTQHFELVSPVSAPSSVGQPFLSEGGSLTTPPTEPNDEAVPVDMDSFPKPLAVCSFGLRSNLKGCGQLPGRWTDSLRATLATLSGRTKDYSHTTLHRKHSYNSLSSQRAQRKYYNHRHHRQRLNLPSQPSLRLPVPPHPHPPPHTPSHPLSSPLTASTVLTNISSLVSLSSSPHNPLSSPATQEDSSMDTRVPPVERSTTTMTPSYTHIVNPSISEGMLPEAGSGFLNHALGHLMPQHEQPTESMETESNDQMQNSKPSGKKSKSRRTKRKKHKQSRITLDNSASVEELRNSNDSRHEDRATPGDVWNTRGDQPSVNGALSDTHLETEVRGQPPSTQRSGVRVKEELVSDTEEIASCHQAPTTKSPTVGLNGVAAPNVASPVHATFNSVNSPQSFVINPSRQLPGTYPLMTTLSPHMRNMLPIPGMPQNANLFPSQQAPRFQLATNQVTSPAGTTSPLHPGLQLIPETIQRQIMQQNAALLFASNNAFLQQHQLQQQSNSLPPGGFINLASMRTGQQQKSPSLGGVAPGLPQLHHVGGSTGPGSLGKSGQVTPPMLSNYQLPNRASQPNNKVRAPISHIPSTTQRSLPQLSSLGQAQSIPGLNQSVYHHGKQVNTPSSATQRFPSQVT